MGGRTGVAFLELLARLSPVPRDFYRSATETMNLHRTFLVVPALALLTSTSGCEQRYVGGPVAIVKGTPPEYGMLGVSFGEPPNALVLSGVLPDGPAFRSGVQTGDEIVALNQQTVATPEDVLSIIRSTQPGDGIVVRVRRSSEETDFNVTLCDFATIVALRNIADLSENAQQHSESEENAEQ